MFVNELTGCAGLGETRLPLQDEIRVLMTSSGPSGIVPASVRCALCESSSASVVGTRGRDGAALRTVACTGCGLVWADPRPHDTRQFYEEDYRRAYKNAFEPRPKHVLRAGRVALDRWSRIRSLLQPGMRVLDVGSGGGEFSYLLAKLGHRVTGVEPNIGYAEYSRREYGLHILRGFIGEVALEPASRDLVTIWHVLEHTENPRAVLTRLREVLVPGGTLVVEVPNIEATCQSPRSTYHAAHLYHFNVATLKELAHRCGLPALRHELSADGGNLTMVFRAEGKPAAAVQGGIPGNHMRVTAVLAGHRPWRHALRPATWTRTLRRLAGALDERLALLALSKPTGRMLLDPVYDDALRQDRPPGPLPALRFAALAASAVASAWWLECELIDDAHHFGWSVAAGTTAYFALQAAMVAAVWLLLKPATWASMRMRLGGLSLMLASMPVLH